MTRRPRAVPIVEGDGEYECVRILLERIWYELVGGEYIDVVRPVRQPRGKLLREAELRQAVRLATGLLNESPASDDPALVPILIGSERECPAALGPSLLAIGGGVDPPTDGACVLAHVRDETRFVASVESLRSDREIEGAPRSRSLGLGQTLGRESVQVSEVPQDAASARHDPSDGPESVS